MPISAEAFDEKEREDIRPILGYAECCACAFGGPGDSNPWHWPVHTQRELDLLRLNKLVCPICGRADSHVFRPSEKLLATRDSKTAIDELKRTRDELDKAKEKLELLQGTGIQTPVRQVAHRIKGQAE